MIARADEALEIAESIDAATAGVLRAGIAQINGNGSRGGGVAGSIIANATIHGVIARTAQDSVVTARSGQAVIIGRADKALEIAQRINADTRSVLRRGDAQINGDGGPGGDVAGNVKPRPAIHGIIASATLYGVVAAIADDAVGCDCAMYRIGQRGAAICGGAGGWAEIDIGGAGIAAIGVSVRGADDEVGEAIAIRIAGRGYGGTRFVTGRDAIEPEAAGAIQTRERDRGGKTAGLAEEHIAGAGIAFAIRVGLIGADDEVIIAIAIHIAGRGHGSAALVAGRNAIKPEAVAAIQAGKVERGGEAGGIAEDHIAGAGIAFAIRVGLIGADDHVSIAIAIHIAGRGCGPAQAVIRRNAIEPEAVAAIQTRKVNGSGKAAGLAEDHIAGAGS